MPTVFSFGDSYVAGVELAAEDIPEFRDRIQQNVKGVQYMQNGAISVSSKCYMKAHAFVNDLALDYYKNQWHIENKNRELSWTGQVAKQLDAKNVNLAAGGASMIKIYHTLLSQIERIRNTPNAIVLVGTTSINRNSQFVDELVSHPLALDGIWDTDQPFDNDGIAHHISVKLLSGIAHSGQQNMRDATQYLMLEDEFNDCTLSKMTYNIGIIYAIKHLLKDIPHVIADMHTSVHDQQRFQSRYLSTNSNNILLAANAMRETVANELYPIAFDDYARDLTKGIDYLCPFTHILPVYHRLYASTVVDYLKDKFGV